MKERSRKSRVAKVPQVMQMEEVECGAASLAMILAYHGRWVRLEMVREECGVSRDGLSARVILRVARNYGLEARGYRLAADNLMGTEPSILHWDYSHFVVFRGFDKKGRAYVNDPKVGPLCMEREEFDRHFSGICLTFEPTGRFTKGGHETSIITYISKHLKGTREALVLTFIFSLLGAFGVMLVPLLTRVFLDEVLMGGNSGWEPWLLASLSVLGAYVFTVVLLHGLYARQLEGALALKSRGEYLRAVMARPMYFFSMRSVGDLQQRMHLTDGISRTLVEVMAPQVVNIALLVLYVVLMASYSVWLTLMGVAAVCVNVWAVRRFASRRVNTTRSMEVSEGRYYAATVSCIDNMDSIKAAGAETGFFQYWSGLWTKRFNANTEAEKEQARMGLLPLLTSGVVNMGVLIVGAWFILKGELTVGMLMAFQGFMGAFLNPVNEVTEGAQRVVSMRSQMERVDDVIGDGQGPRSEEEGARRMEIGKLGGLVELKNVTFGYSALQPPLIENLNLRIEPGHSVAIVGKSGCGKSTLAKLISGLYQPWSGEILFDGRPIESISREELTNSVAVIDQNIVLFDDTVGQNIRMWDTSIEDFSVLMACNDAQIRKEIVSRPEGFATKIVNGGQNFSGGQRQRIEMATALAKEPSILIMDEATSALDTKTEEEVMANIRRISPTQIIIAHRLSTTRDCDEIIVLDQGHIVQRGRYEELMEQEGEYRELMSSGNE